MRSFSLAARSLVLALALAALPNAAALPRTPAEPRAEPDAPSAANLTLIPPLENRAIAGQATHYSPAREGPSPIGSCGGRPMNDNTMGVALSQAGWDRFARHGLTQADLCWKDLVIYGPNGKKQTAQLMDTCPYDEATQTCGSVCDLDLTTGLFAKLEQPALGIFPIKWSFTDGTPSGCGPSKKGGSSSSKSSGSTPTATSKHHTATHTTSSSTTAKPAPHPAAGTTEAAASPKPAAEDPIMAALSALFGGMLGAAQPSSSAAPAATQKSDKVYSPASSEKDHVDSLQDMLQAIVQAIIQ